MIPLTPWTLGLFLLVMIPVVYFAARATNREVKRAQARMEREEQTQTTWMERQEQKRT